MNFGIFLLSAVLLMSTSTRIAVKNVGFQQISVLDPQGKPITVGVWYPSEAPAAISQLGMFTQTVAINGPILGNHLPLILISHGTSGSLASHYDTALALASAGFVVAAITHTGDNFADQSFVGNWLDLIDRPRQIHVVLDYLFESWKARARLDPLRIGMFGFSLGAFTTLVEVGGTPDLTRLVALCTSRPNAPECIFVKQRHGDQMEPPSTAPIWVHDPRIKAAVIAAPAVSFFFEDGGLKQVLIPVQMWRAEKDQQVPDAWNSAVVRKELPKSPEEHVVPGADHFVFLAPCSDMLAKVAPAICEDPLGFNRTAFHDAFNHALIAFFTAQLNQ